MLDRNESTKIVMLDVGYSLGLEVGKFDLLPCFLLHFPFLFIFQKLISRMDNTIPEITFWIV